MSNTASYFKSTIDTTIYSAIIRIKGGDVMALSGDKYPFTQDNIDKSPTASGVYALYDEYITIYIGKGDGENGIRARLQAHKSGAEGSCTKNASHYRREVCLNPTTRERELLQEYKYANGKLPRCNDVMP